MADPLTSAEFDGLPPWRPRDRLFLAIFPDSAAAGRISALAGSLSGECGLHGDPLGADRLYLALHHVCDFVANPPRSVVDAACEAAEAARPPPIEISFNRAMSIRGSPKPRFVLLGGENAALMAFHRALGESMARFGLRPSATASFTPHVTLLYDDRVVIERAVEPIGWVVDEFVLARTRLGRRGLI